MQPSFKHILEKYLPASCVDQVEAYILRYAIRLKITRDRRSKLGDYRPPGTVKAHIISLNGSLNAWTFYLVFLHELAHLLVWQKYRNQVEPHGQQWKDEFRCLLQPLIIKQFFPQDLNSALARFAQNIKAGFASDRKLWKILKSYDPDALHQYTIEDLPENSLFVASNGKIFKKENRVRTRYRCYCLSNQRRYLFHPLATIEPLEESALAS